jgi:hypothetical protein
MSMSNEEFVEILKDLIELVEKRTNACQPLDARIVYERESRVCGHVEAEVFHFPGNIDFKIEVKGIHPGEMRRR